MSHLEVRKAFGGQARTLRGMTGLEQATHRELAVLAKRLGLTYQPAKKRWQSVGLRLSFSVSGGKQQQVTITISQPVRGAPKSLSIRAEGYDSAVSESRGVKELEFGDLDFDDAFWVTAGDPKGARKWLTPERRSAVLLLFEGEQMELAEGWLSISAELKQSVESTALKAIEVAGGAVDLLEDPPEVSAVRAPGAVNARQRRRIWLPLLGLAALTGLVGWGLDRQPALLGSAACFAATSAAWALRLPGARVGLQVSRGVCLVLVVWFWVAALQQQTARDGLSTGMTALTGCLSLIVAHWMLHTAVTASRRIRLD
jgi:uncharacterized membrane protein (UPF0136 family)